MVDQRIWPATDGPSTSAGDAQPVNVATEFEVTSPAWAIGLRYYRGTFDANADNLRLYQVESPSTGTVLAELVAPALSGLGWQEFPIDPVPLAIGQAYRAAAHFGNEFTATAGYFAPGGPGASGFVNGFLTVPNAADAVGPHQGSYNYDPSPRMPDLSFNGGSYWVDVVVTDEDPTAEEPSGSGLAVLALASTSDGAKTVAESATAALALAGTVDGAKAITGPGAAPLTLGGAVDGQKHVADSLVTTLALASSSSGGPVTGPIPAVVSPVLCAPWATPADVPQAIREEFAAAGVDDVALAAQLMRASELLWMLTGRRWYGIGCTEEVTLRSSPPPANWGAPWSWHETWGHCACWSMAAALLTHIPEPTRVKLPRSPVQAISSVLVDGVALATDTYRLNHAGVLERLDGAWMVCQANTVVTYTYGEAPPAGGRDAAVTLAIELVRDMHGVGSCRLPSNVTSTTRQEVTLTFADPNEYLENGRIGLASVDTWVTAVNPGKRAQRARVYSPDVPQTVNRRSL